MGSTPHGHQQNLPRNSAQSTSTGLFPPQYYSQPAYLSSPALNQQPSPRTRPPVPLFTVNSTGHLPMAHAAESHPPKGIFMPECPPRVPS